MKASTFLAPFKFRITFVFYLEIKSPKPNSFAVKVLSFSFLYDFSLSLC